MFFAVVECPGKTIMFMKNNVYERQMVEYSDCSEWFHIMCERTPDVVSPQKIQNAIGWVIRAHQKELKLHIRT